MITIPILQTTIFGLYIWYVIAKFGILPSVSQSWYVEANVNGKKKKWMFVAFIVSISTLTILLGYLTKNIWFYASGGSLLIVAFAPAFRSEHRIVGILHTGGTVLGIAFACYAMITHGIYFPFVFGAAITLVIERLKIENSTFWNELVWFYSIMIGIFQLVTLHL